jgi:hypothetical protein
MGFIRNIILRAGIGATSIRAAAHFISIFLINAITLNAQIAPPGNAARPEARVIAQHADRILPLLAALADQASLSADLTFAVRAQSQAATLLWPYEREQARAIYRRAFQSLVCNDSATPKAASVHRPSRSGAVGEYEASELYGSSLEVTFAALGRADFEGARSLAQQLTKGDVSVLAQLAACRGGLEVLVPHKKVPHILQETGQ